MPGVRLPPRHTNHMNAHSYRKLLQLVTVLVIALSPVISSSQDGQWQKHMREGHEAFKQRDFALAESHYLSALKGVESQPGPSEELAEILNSMGALYLRTHRLPEAERVYKREISVRLKLKGPEDFGYAFAQRELATIYTISDRNGEALLLLREALATVEKVKGPEHIAVALLLSDVAKVYHVEGRSGEAEPLLARSLTLFEKSLGPDHHQVAAVLEQQAGVLRALKRNAEADGAGARARLIREKGGEDRSFVIAP